MKVSKPLIIAVLAFVVGAAISQASLAFADDSSNPLVAIWQAISELQTKTNSLQSQIDDIKTAHETAAPEAPGTISEPSVAVKVSGGEAGQTLIQVIARNAGPQNAVGVKLATYYQMSLFKINSINGAECTNQARGIIECYLGTLGLGSEAIVTINATPLSLGQQAVITSDISSTTDDANQADNHAEAVFTTSSTPVAIQPTTPAQPPAQTPAVQPAPEQLVPQQPSGQSQSVNDTQTTDNAPTTNSTQSGSGGEQPAAQQGNATQTGSPGSNQTSSGSSENAGSSSGSSSSGPTSGGESGAPSSSESGSTEGGNSTSTSSTNSTSTSSGGESAGSVNPVSSAGNTTSTSP